MVDRNDNAFRNPTKPIGPFYTESERSSLVMARNDLIVAEEPGKGFRRVVPSPDPKLIVESEAIRLLVNSGAIVIASGGGGIPVVESGEHELHGVDAVIDKDLAAERLATSLEAEEIAILTDVPGVFINYRKKNEQLLTKIQSRELENYAKTGQFASGSMGPKVEAALRFIAHGGRRAIIAELDSVDKAIEGTVGTQILP
jgi:carbamate kinase